MCYCLVHRNILYVEKRWKKNKNRELPVRMKLNGRRLEKYKDVYKGVGIPIKVVYAISYRKI